MYPIKIWVVLYGPCYWLFLAALNIALTCMPPFNALSIMTWCVAGYSCIRFAQGINRLVVFKPVYDECCNCFGSKENANEWLCRKCIFLQGRIPLEMISTIDGAKAVIDYINKIEAGVYI